MLRRTVKLASELAWIWNSSPLRQRSLKPAPAISRALPSSETLCVKMPRVADDALALMFAAPICCQLDAYRRGWLSDVERLVSNGHSMCPPAFIGDGFVVVASITHKS